MLKIKAVNIINTYDYDDCGNLISKIGETENNYLYCGEQYDGTTGYYYLRARYMNPKSGTFVTMDTYQGTINDPVSLHKYLYANANPVMNIDPTGNFTLGELNVTQAINGILSKAQTINYQKVLARLASNATGGAVYGGVDALLGDEDLAEVIKSIGFGAVSGMILGVFAQYNCIKRFLCGCGYAALVAGVKESFDNDRPGQACFRAIMCVALAFSLVNGNSSTVEEKTYYHVTTKESAAQIIESGELNHGRFESKVFAWKKQPTLSQANAVGIGNRSETVLKFKTNASFEKDTYVNDALQHLAVRTVDGTVYPIKITDVSEVGFKKEW